MSDVRKTILLGLTTLSLLGAAYAQTAKPATTAGSMSSMKMDDKMVTTINVNTASKADLMKVPGVGPAMAAAIMKARPIRNQADLIARVKGIGEKNGAKLGKYFKY
jgi:competence protein ComEA